MAVEKVELNSGDNRSHVADVMALDMWRQTHEGHSPQISDKGEFLNLVQDCGRALKPRFLFEAYETGK